MLQRGALVLGSPRCPRGAGGQRKGRDCAAAGVPGRRQLEPLPEGLTVPGKREDDFRQTKCTENWILQPLTLLRGLYK